MSDNKYHSFHGINRNGNVGTLLYVHGNDNAQFCGNESCYPIADLTENFIKGNLSFDDSLEIVKKKKITYAPDTTMQAMFSDRNGRVLIIEPGIGYRLEKEKYSLITNYSILKPELTNPYVLSGDNRYEKAKDLLRYVLHAGNDLARMHGIDTAAVGAAVLEMEKDENGIYHARPDCWQQYFGYSFLYDYAFDAGTSMATDQFYFDYAGEQYAFWIWRGDYINLGAGAEAGIYYGGGPFWAVDTDLAMRMSMDVYYKDENIISYSDTTWWLTGFNPEYLNVSAGDMSGVYTIVFSDPGMFSAFCAANGKYWNCNPMNFSATYRFG